MRGGDFGNGGEEDRREQTPKSVLLSDVKCDCVNKFCTFRSNPFGPKDGP